MANTIFTIEELRKKAKEYGVDVRFRNTKTAQGDFGIYLYDRQNFRKSYAVCYDGTWNSTHNTDFDACIRMAYRWLERRDKRFTFRDGRWQYGHYHLIVWKDRKSRDCDFYLTLDDADKAAVEYVKQGSCVVCYDTEPTGKYKLAKIWGDYDRHANDYVIRSIKKWAFKK